MHSWISNRYGSLHNRFPNSAHVHLPGKSDAVGWDCRIHRLHLFSGVRLPPNECPGYDSKHFDGESGALGNAEYPFIAIALKIHIKTKAHLPATATVLKILFSCKYVIANDSSIFTVNGSSDATPSQDFGSGCYLN